MKSVWGLIALILFYGLSTEASDVNGVLNSFPEGIATGIRFQADGKLTGGTGWVSATDSQGVTLQKKSPYTGDSSVFKLKMRNAGKAVVALIPDYGGTTGKVLVASTDGGDVTTATKCDWSSDGKVLSISQCITINAGACSERLNLPPAQQPKYTRQMVINLLFNEHATANDLIARLQSQESKNLDTIRMSLTGQTVAIDASGSTSQQWKQLIDSQVLNENRARLQNVADFCDDLKFPGASAKNGNSNQPNPSAR